MTKGNKLELQELEKLKIDVVLTRKEVKNISSLRNIVSSFEDRYLALIFIEDKCYLLVLKKWLALATETKKRISYIYQYSKSTLTGSATVAENPYINENPYN